MEESMRHDKLPSILQDQSLTLEYLRKITDNFSDRRLLGEGGFGKVYKGVLQNGDTIAVKKFASSIPGAKDRHFGNEAGHLMRLKHPNIVLLVGCCSVTENTYVEYKGKYICAEKLERLLCFEYMPKGNLRGYLSNESSGLDWNTRYKIIEGICSGLHYLHDEWQPNSTIIHMDLKPANILLDNDMVPKIADFGLSRLFSEEQTRTCTTSRYGTLGYMAPEYINRGIITKKADIFSLGVIITEIVTGHKDYPDETGASSQEFIETVLKNWRNRLEKELGCTSTSLELDCQQIRRCIQTALVCVNLDRSKRPTISQIIEMLHEPEGAECSYRKKEIVADNKGTQRAAAVLVGTYIDQSSTHALIHVEGDGKSREERGRDGKKGEAAAAKEEERGRGKKPAAASNDGGGGQPAAYLQHYYVQPLPPVQYYYPHVTSMEEDPTSCAIC